MLYAQDTIGAEVIEAELREGAPVRTALVDVDEADAFVHTVARYVEHIFAGRDGRLPPAGLYGKILREVERPLIAQGAHRDPRQSAPGRGVARRQSQHLAQEIRELDIEVMRGPR